MEHASVQERPHAAAEERARHELVMRILKLRWMGMENEAEQVEAALRKVEPSCTLMAGPFDTD